jgi:hypothetical protein
LTAVPNESLGSFRIRRSEPPIRHLLVCNTSLDPPYMLLRGGLRIRAYIEEPKRWRFAFASPYGRRPTQNDTAGWAAAIGETTLGTLGSSIEDDRIRGETVDVRSNIVVVLILLPAPAMVTRQERSSRSTLFPHNTRWICSVEIFIRTQLRMLQLDVRSILPPFSCFSVLGVSNRRPMEIGVDQGKRRGQ